VAKANKKKKTEDVQQKRESEIDAQARLNASLSVD